MLDRVKNALSTAKKRDQGVTTETKANTDQVFKIAGEILDDVKNQVMKNLFPNQPVIKSEEDVDKAGESILPNTVLGKRTNPEENKSEDSLVIDTKNNGGGGGGGGGPGQRPPTNNNNNNNQSNSKKPKGNKGSSNKKGPGGEGGGG